MIKSEFTFKDSYGYSIHVYKWSPEQQPKGIVQIAHGMAEHAKRYVKFAEQLTNLGYIVYANDHRGHGLSSKSVEDLGFCEENGFEKMIQNVKELTLIIRNENPNLPIFLFGHSMGSFILQRYISKYPTERIQGVILSGSNGKTSPLILNIGIILAKIERKRLGERGKSKLLNDLVFGNYKSSIKNYETDFDWLSRDKEEVKKYINDPYCGNIHSTQFYIDFLNELKIMHSHDEMKKVNKSLPVFIVSGDKDPVGGNGKGIHNLIELYKKQNVTDVSYKLYRDGRHELLNELNRDEVMNDIISWIMQK